MPNNEPPKNRILQAALGPGGQCLPVEQLEKFVIDGSIPPAPLAAHVESCTYCQTQIQLLREFGVGTLHETEAQVVRLITSRLQARSNEIFRAAREPAEARDPWWRVFWRASWLSPPALALAGILVVVAVGLQMRNGPPGLRPPRPDNEVLRSNAISVIAPSGDIPQAPGEIRWQAAPHAARYEARLLEVDGAELWKGETSETRIEFPAAVRARVVPAKTLLCQVSAFDASGHLVARSETVPFRLLQ
jgi:hypothetical protein